MRAHTLASFLLAAGAACFLAFAPGASAQIWDTVPDVQLENLGLSRDATPKQLYDALTERYLADYSKGKYAEWWEPIPLDMYLAPTLFYQPPALDLTVQREDCVACHTSVTHGWVLSWQKSVHADLEAIRQLPADDVRAYKKDIIATVEGNLVSQGLLRQGQKLGPVDCIDCHIGVGRQSANHNDIRMPDRAACGQCHVRQFAEAESEKDTQKWLWGEWPDGRPSHALDYMADVELETFASLPQREVATGCTMCHTHQPKCDDCHARHTFATVEARKPETCSTCHTGVDHPNYENYMLSRHGVNYATQGDQWNWDARLSDALDKGGYTAPTCAWCHFDNGQGQFTHNVTYKVRWGFLPGKVAAEHLDEPFYKNRLQMWERTCSTCHSPRFAQTYLAFMDEGIKQGVDLVEANRAVVQKLYDDGLLVGQKTNRPAPPGPDTDAPGGFYSLFISSGNNPTMLDRVFTEMWEQHLASLMTAYEHANPGGWSYGAGWSQLIRAQTFINEEDTRLREQAQLKADVASLLGRRGAGAASTDGTRGSVTGIDPRYAGGGLGLLGAALVLGGGAALRRRKRLPRD